MPLGERRSDGIGARRSFAPRGTGPQSHARSLAGKSAAAERVENHPLRVRQDDHAASRAGIAKQLVQLPARRSHQRLVALQHLAQFLGRQNVYVWLGLHVEAQLRTALPRSQNGEGNVRFRERAFIQEPAPRRNRQLTNPPPYHARTRFTAQL